jgi:hypothetical protein
MDDMEKEWIQETLDYAGKIPYVNKDLLERLLVVYALENDDKEKIKEEIDSMISEFSYQIFLSKKPLLECPSKAEVQGEIKIGNVLHADKALHSFGLNPNELTRHVGIYGQTGHGKTSLLYTIINQLTKLKIPFLYLDLKKDGRCLLRQHEELIVIPWRELRWNPLRPPPDMDVKSWWQLFAEVCGHAWGVYHAGVNYILEYLDRLHEEQKGAFPTLVDLYRMMAETQETTRKRLEYFDVMYNRVRALTSILGSVIDVQTGIKMEELLNHPVIIELDQLRADEQNWMVETMLTWLYAYRLVQGHRSEKLRHCVIIDEAHRIFDANKEWRETTREMGMPPINLFPTQFRDFGESLIIASQEPSKITDSMHANTLVKIVGNLGSGKDINAVSEAMSLDDEERECIPKLQRGEWLVKMSDRYMKPFMITTPYQPVDKDITDEEVKHRMLTLLPKQTEQKRQPKQQVAERVISKNAWELLSHVNSHPFQGIAGRAKEMGISPSMFESAKAELIDAVLVNEASFSLSGRRPTKFLVPTEKALQLLESRGMNTGMWRHVGNMNFEHMLYQVLLRWEFKKLGFDARLEAKFSEGRRIDVLAVKNGRKIGVEVELNTNVDLRNKLNGIESLDELYIVTKKEIYSDIKHKLGTLPNVKVYSIDRFLEALRNLYVEKIRINSSEQNKSESTLFRENHFDVSHSGQKRKESNSGGVKDE